MKKSKLKKNQTQGKRISRKPKIIVGKDIEIEKSFDPQEIPRTLNTFPSQFYYMSNFQITKKKKKKSLNKPNDDFFYE
jgi:hypothetical protein